MYLFEIEFTYHLSVNWFDQQSRRCGSFAPRPHGRNSINVVLVTEVEPAEQLEDAIASSTNAIASNGDFEWSPSSAARRDEYIHVNLVSLN